MVALPLSRSHADLVGWWTFDEGVGITAGDTSPDGATHAGGLESGASFLRSGKFDGAVTLDGGNGIVRISDHADFEFDQNTSFTLASWFRTAWNFSNTRGFIGKGYELIPHEAGYFIMRAGGELLALINLALASGSQSVQSVACGDDAPWPKAADGNGF
ncbi:MAG: hypothetical protein OSB65_09880 [Roseibacillus sp.]|nr:hypothetical protein [Roseibacillus sp.]